MIIIGLTGGIGHGKSTLASYMEACTSVHAHLESSDVIAEVANDLLSRSRNKTPNRNDIAAINDWLGPLPDILLQRTHNSTTFDKLRLTSISVNESPEYYNKFFDFLDTVTKNPHLVKQHITHSNKNLYRSLLQWLGGYIVHAINEGVWFDELCRRAMEHADDTLVTISGVRYPSDAKRVKNIGGIIIEINRPSLDSIDANDITERERSAIIPDIRVVSDAGLVELERCAQAVYLDISTSNGVYAPSYTTSNY